jgi:DNA-binding transcriptional ArsR family regulator
MPAARTDVFTTEDQHLAQLAKALAHPARIAILRILAQRKSCVCGELVELMPLAQATVSQHLRELKEAGLIQGSIDGPRVCYCLHPAGLRRLREGFAGLFEEVVVHDSSSCC